MSKTLHLLSAEETIVWKEVGSVVVTTSVRYTSAGGDAGLSRGKPKAALRHFTLYAI